MPPPPNGGGIKRINDAFVCLLSVAYIGPKSRTERPRKTKISRGSPRHTWLGHHFQGQMVNGQLVGDVLNSQHAGTGATWRINMKTVSTCRGVEASWRPPARLQLVFIAALSPLLTHYPIDANSDWNLLSLQFNDHFSRWTWVSRFYWS